MKGFLVKSVFLFFCIYLGFPGSLTSGNPFCFSFTWVGPAYTHNGTTASNVSSVCQGSGSDFCVKPFVITKNGTPPNFTDLWEYFSGSGNERAIACTQAGRTCMKWTSFFDGQVEYTTHTCSRIIVDGDGTMTSGCITSTANRSRTTEVCACNSRSNYQPCNSGHHPYNSTTVTGLLMVFFLALKFVT